MKKLMQRWQASRLGRTVTMYGQRGGAVLAGGVAYAALFSVFGALVAGFSVLGLFLSNNADLFDQVVKAVSEAMPGLLDTGNGGAVKPQSLVNSNLVSWTGIVAFAAALFAGLGWVDSLRTAVRQMFDIPPYGRNFVMTKLLDVVWLACLGGVLLVSAVLSMAVGSIARPVLDAIGLQGPVVSFLLQALALAIVVLVDALALTIIYRWLSGLRLPFLRLRSGVLIGAVAMALLTNFSGQLVGSAGSKNPLLATGALLVTLLVLFNFISRVMLYVACWIANFDPLPEPAEATEPLDLSKGEPGLAGPGLVGQRLVAQRVAGQMVAGQPAGGRAVPAYAAQLRPVPVRAGDRVSAAAGFTLGATVVLGFQTMLGGARALADLVRQP